MSSIFAYYLHSLISHYLPCDWQSKLMHVSNNIYLFFTRYFFLFVQIHLSQIFTILTKIWAYDFKQYVTACFHILSCIIISIFFWLRTCLIYILFAYVTIFCIIWRQEGVRIHYKSIPEWIKLTQAIIILPTQYRTKFEIPFGEVFWKYNRVVRQPASLYLDSLIKTSSCVFSHSIFTRP